MVKIKHQAVKRWESQLYQFKQMFHQGFNGTSDEPHDRGSVIILVALSLTALLGFCAIVTDIGLTYAEKAHLQNSVNAAALAGVVKLPSYPDDVKDIVIEYAEKNGVVVLGKDVIVDQNNSKIIVTAYKQVPTHFARVLGITEDNILISATSRAIMVPPNVIYGAVPLSIQEQYFDNTIEYVLKSGGRENDSDLYLGDAEDNALEGTPGWYGALELSGDDPGANMYRQYLAEGYPENLSVGQIVDVKTGNMSGPTKDGIKLRLNQIVHVPIVEVIPDSGKSIHKVQIVGFAAFLISGVPGNGNDSDLKGFFIGTMPTIGQSNDFGFYTPKLVAN